MAFSNAFIERFNRTYREEVLDAYIFESLTQILSAARGQWPATSPWEALTPEIQAGWLAVGNTILAEMDAVAHREGTAAQEWQIHIRVAARRLYLTHLPLDTPDAAPRHVWICGLCLEQDAHEPDCLIGRILAGDPMHESHTNDESHKNNDSDTNNESPRP